MEKVESQQHKRLVKGLIDALEGHGMTILEAAYPGYDEPSKRGRHEPDIFAKDTSALLHIGEAKTPDDLASDHSKEQYEDFSDRVMKSDGRVVPFHIHVPANARGDLIVVLEEVLTPATVSRKIAAKEIVIWTS